MRVFKLLCLINCFSAICLSQTALVPVTFIIEDIETHKEIVAALVTVRQTALTQPTLANGKVKFENVPVGEIEYYIMKEGYQFETGRVNVSTDIKTNNFRISILKLDDKKILVTGEVSDAEGRDLKGAMVEVKIADQVRTVMTDESGNYSADIAPSTKFLSTTMRVEVKKGDCKKTETIDIPRTNVVYKDFKLDCTKTGDVPQKSAQSSMSTFKKNNLLFELISCTQSGQTVECIIRVTSIDKDKEFQICVCGKGYNDLTTSSGNEYFATSALLGNQMASGGWAKKELVSNVPVNYIYSFTKVDENIKSIPRMQFTGFVDDSQFKFEFRDVTIR